MFSVLEGSELVSRSRRIALEIPAVALLFLPFAGNLSPWGAVCEGLTAHHAWAGFARLFAVSCAPFFLSIPILIAQTRLLLKGQFSSAERSIYRRLAYAALLLGMVFPVGLPFAGLLSRGDLRRLFFPLILALPYAAAWMLILIARRRNPEEAVMVTLRAAWLPNAIYCVIGALVAGAGWNIPAFMAAFTIVVYAVEIAVSMGWDESIYYGEKASSPDQPPE